MNNGINLYSAEDRIKKAFVYELFSFACLPDNNPSQNKIDYIEDIAFKIGLPKGIQFIFETPSDKVMGYTAIGARKETKKLDTESKQYLLGCLKDISNIDGSSTMLQEHTIKSICQIIGVFMG